VNDTIPRGHSVPHRASFRRALLLTVVIGGVLLAAGCAGGHDGQGGQAHRQAANGGGKTPYERALTIAQCMRQNGVPSYPDPGSDGAFPASANANKSSASFQAAVRICDQLPSNGVGNSPF
jgi:hypothetical protein